MWLLNLDYSINLGQYLKFEEVIQVAQFSFKESVSTTSRTTKLQIQPSTLTWWRCQKQKAQSRLPFIVQTSKSNHNTLIIVVVMSFSFSSTSLSFSLSRPTHLCSNLHTITVRWYIFFPFEIFALNSELETEISIVNCCRVHQIALIQYQVVVVLYWMLEVLPSVEDFVVSSCGYLTDLIMI